MRHVPGAALTSGPGLSGGHGRTQRVTARLDLSPKVSLTGGQPRGREREREGGSEREEREPRASGIEPRGLPSALTSVRLPAKLQALLYDILPSTTAVFSYAIGSRKLSANEQFFLILWGWG